eukprot:2111359-Prymnesium_polylepis.1
MSHRKGLTQLNCSSPEGGYMYVCIDRLAANVHIRGRNNTNETDRYYIDSVRVTPNRPQPLCARASCPAWSGS